MTQVATASAAPLTAAARKPAYSTEFACVLACLRWPLDDVAIEHVQATSANVADWQRLVAIAARHRVIGLVSNALTKAGIALPDAARTHLRSLSAEQTRQAMLHAAETIRIDRLLRAHNVEAVFLKGATVTQLAYGRLDLRHAKDVDMMVSDADVPATLEALRSAGYLPLAEAASLTPQQLRRWLRFGKSMDWRHPGTGGFLELHWRLTDLSLLETAFHTDTRQQVPLAGGAAVTTLDRDHLFAYLCVHGAAHGWSRLKWLADVYALLPHEDAAACEAMYRTAIAIGAGRTAGQALLLCHALLQLPLTPRLQKELTGDPVLRLLTATSLKLMARGNETEEIYDLPFGTTSVYLSRFLLGNGGRSALAELRTLLFPVEQAAHSRLPNALLFLFPLVRAVTWFGARVRHGGRSKQA